LTISIRRPTTEPCHQFHTPTAPTINATDKIATYHFVRFGAASSLRSRTTFASSSASRLTIDWFDAPQAPSGATWSSLRAIVRLCPTARQSAFGLSAAAAGTLMIRRQFGQGDCFPALSAGNVTVSKQNGQSNDTASVATASAFAASSASAFEASD